MMQTSESSTKIIQATLILLVVANLFIPGERSELQSALTQIIILGLATLSLLFFKQESAETEWRTFFFLFATALLLSQINSLAPLHSARSGLTLLTIFVFGWLAQRSCRREAALRRVSIILSIAAALISLWAINQYFFFFRDLEELALVTKILPVTRDYLTHMFTQKRVFASFLLPTTLSIFSAMMLPISIALVIYYRQKRLFSILFIITSTLIIATLALAQSNGGPVALILAVAVATPFALRRINIRWKLWLPIFALAMILLVVAVGLFRGSFLWDFSSTNNPVRLRWMLWGAAANIIGNHGLLGIGAGSFKLALAPYLSGDVRPAQHVHNSYLQFPLELGILGGIALALALFLIIRKLLKLQLRAQTIEPIPFALFVSSLVFLVANLFEIVLFFPSLGLLGALIIGAQFASDRQRGPEMTINRKPATLAVSTLLLLLILLTCKWYVAEYFFIKANNIGLRSQINAEKSLDDSRSEHFPTDDVLINLDAALFFESRDSRYHDRKATLLSQHADSTEPAVIEHHYKRAIELVPRIARQRYNYAIFLLGQNRPLDALSQLRTAVQMHPNNPDYISALQTLEAKITAAKRSAPEVNND